MTRPIKYVVVTGAKGFIGRSVSRHISSQGVSVMGIGHGDWFNAESLSWGLSYWKASDVTISAFLDLPFRPDVIVHCAGGSAVGSSIAFPHEDFKKTVSSTVETLEYIRRNAPACKLVYISTAAVYGDVVKLPIAEAARLDPISPYGTHKCIAEQMCKLYAKTYEIDVSIIRFFSVYGPGIEKQLLWDACQKIISGNLVFNGTGDELRDWIHIHDAVRLVDCAISNADADCPVVNGGSGKGTSVRMIIEWLSSALGVDKGIYFSSDGRQGDPRHFIACVDKSSKWGWTTSVDLEGGVKEYAQWYSSTYLNSEKL